MATVIDALLVTLGLDASAFKTGTIEAAKQQSKLENLLKKDSKERTELDKKAADAQKKRAEQFEKQGKHAAETFGKIRDHALGLIAVLAGGVGIAEFGKEMITGAANVKRLADNLGMHSRQVQAWQSSLKAVGGTAQSASNMLLTMSDSMTALHTSGMGPTSQMSAMQKFGINPGATNNAATGLLRVSRYLSALYKIHPNEAREHAAEMGFDESQFNLLKHYYALKKKLAYYEVHPVYTKAQEQQAVMMQTKLVQFGNSVKRVATAIAYQFLPIFQKLLVKFQGWANWAMSHQSQIVGWVDMFVAGLIKLGKEVNHIAQDFGGWKVVIATLAALKLASMASGFVNLALALTKVGGSLTGITEASGGLMILKALGKAGLLGAAGFGGYELGKHVVNPALNKGIKYASGGSVTSIGQAVYELVHGNPSYYRDQRKAHSREVPIVNNNPGDLRSWGNMPLVKAGNNGYFAKFPTMEAGMAAAAENLRAYQRQGLDTLNKIIPVWNGHGANTPQYIAAVRAITGYGANQKLNMQDPHQLAKVLLGIMDTEAGGKYYNPATARTVADVIARGHRATINIPRVSAAASAPVRAATVINHHNRSAASVVNQNSSEAHIGQVVVHTNSQDPADHGRLLAQAFRRYTTVDAINSGVL